VRFRPTTAIVLRQFYLVRGSVARIPPLFVWVAVDVILWGFITRYLDSIASPGFGFVPTLLGAVLLWDFFTRAMHGVTMAFLEDVWSRNFLNVFASPITTTEYVSGLVLTTVVTSAIALVVMFALATTLFGLSLALYGAMIVPFLFVLFLFGIALGIVGSAIVLRLGPASEWFIWPIPVVVSPFVGVFYPIATLPAWMQWIGRALPPSYVFENLRAIVRGGAGSPSELLWSAALAIGYIALASWCFARVYRYAVRTGLLARYSAESVS
jgi:ABC-2 type transport system permease protein